MTNGSAGFGVIAPLENAPEGEGLGCVSFETALVRQITPQAGDFDELGHVNNVVYLRWVQDMAVTHWHAVATPEMIEAEVWIALKHTIEYRDPILPGESAEIRTWLGEVRGPRFDRHVDIRKPGAKRFSARAVTEWCRINRATRRPMRIGRDVLDLFQVPG
ncbi:acyl-CoA thioesterase [Maricaulis salignorans]|uniref:Acyl-CoA thioester hydrolase n=1 Tax=Maricaulis salignorans TaxID=144026 RepID=A0A1G9MXB6_9PROT|nr:thioesterase family protein [Maricaulis salignorans]SDL78764.1 acyl-CoA thioester hydrolase [Maricaulis salignorans]